VEHLEVKERQLQAIMGDLRRSGRNMGFLRKRSFDHFSRFGIEGLLSVSSILISVLLLRSPIISYYVNFLAISRMPYPAIMGDFLERCFDEYHNLKASDFNRGSLIDQDGDLDHPEEEMGNVVNSEVGNRKPGDRSPVPPYHLPCHENFPAFLLSPSIILIIIIIALHTGHILERGNGWTDAF